MQLLEGVYVHPILSVIDLHLRFTLVHDVYFIIKLKKELNKRKGSRSSIYKIEIK